MKKLRRNFHTWSSASLLLVPSRHLAPSEARVAVSVEARYLSVLSSLFEQTECLGLVLRLEHRQHSCWTAKSLSSIAWNCVYRWTDWRHPQTEFRFGTNVRQERVSTNQRESETAL